LRCASASRAGEDSPPETRGRPRIPLRVLTVLHASDLHFGRHFQPSRAEALLASILEIQPDLLVFSGDFTQRAKVREYKEARAFLDRLPDIPLVVTPGNHDVPLYRVWERVFAPLSNYRRYIHDVLDSVVRIPGATVVALNSTAPLGAITNGRLTGAQLRMVAEAFEGAPEHDLRILVTHHHFISPQDAVRDRPMRGARRLVFELERLGTDLVFGGHIHRSYALQSTDMIPGGAGRHPVLFVQSGTTTSARGRGAEGKRNTLNIVRVSATETDVTHRAFDEAEERFLAIRTRAFVRPGSSAGREGALER
jgi:3',5'-cyclic AMP phosphodiesterase CpdA